MKTLLDDLVDKAKEIGVYLNNREDLTEQIKNIVAENISWHFGSYITTVVRHSLKGDDLKHPEEDLKGMFEITLNKYLTK